MRRRDFIKMIAAVATVCPKTAGAETYPSRPITMVIPFAPGGGFDVLGRKWRGRHHRGEASGECHARRLYASAGQHRHTCLQPDDL
jgi:hypothetical protein